MQSAVIYVFMTLILFIVFKIGNLKRRYVGMDNFKSVFDILDSPEVKVERQIVYSSQGCSAQLVCYVSGKVPASRLLCVVRGRRQLN